MTLCCWYIVTDTNILFVDVSGTPFVTLMKYEIQVKRFDIIIFDNWNVS